MAVNEGEKLVVLETMSILTVLSQNGPGLDGHDGRNGLGLKLPLAFLHLSL